MKKVVRPGALHPAELPVPQKTGGESVWCRHYGYFIDLEACRARSYSKSVCRRCYPSLLQLSLPFD
jgi:hypothetical protein